MYGFVILYADRTLKNTAADIENLKGFMYSFKKLWYCKTCGHIKFYLYHYIFFLFLQVHNYKKEKVKKQFFFIFVSNLYKMLWNEKKKIERLKINKNIFNKKFLFLKYKSSFLFLLCDYETFDHTHTRVYRNFICFSKWFQWSILLWKSCIRNYR